MEKFTLILCQAIQMNQPDKKAVRKDRHKGRATIDYPGIVIGTVSKKIPCKCQPPTVETGWTYKAAFSPGTFWMCESCHEVFMVNENCHWASKYERSYRDNRKARQFKRAWKRVNKKAAKV